MLRPRKTVILVLNFILLCFVNLYIVDIHARLSVCRKGGDAIRVVNSREIAADCEIEKDEEVVVEIVSRAPIIRYIGNSHLVIWLGIRILVQVDVHSQVLLVPHQRKEVEFAVLEAIRPCAGLGIVRICHISAAHVLIETPVASAVEVLFLCSGLDSVGMTHLEDVYLATARPTYGREVITHHPKRRPESVCRLRQFYAGIEATILEGFLLARIDACGSKGPSPVVLALGRDDKALSS